MGNMKRDFKTILNFPGAGGTMIANAPLTSGTGVRFGSLCHACSALWEIFDTFNSTLLPHFYIYTYIKSN